MRRFSSIIVTLCVIVSVGTRLSHAQETPIAPPTASPAVILPDNDLKSPRSTVATFLAAMDPSDGDIEMARATKALDTSEIPELVRTERAEELAVKLYAILTFKNISASKAPYAPTEDAIQLADVAGLGIHLERSGPNWIFSKATVANVPQIFREIEPRLSKREMRELADASNTWLLVRTYIPERLKGTTFLVEDWQWIAAAIALVLLIILQRALTRVCRWIIIRLLSARLGFPPTLNAKPLGRPIGVVLFTIAVQLFLLTIDLPITVYTSAVQWLATIRIFAMVFLGVYLVDLLGERLTSRASRTISTVDDILYPLVQKALWLFVIILGIAQTLSVHGVDVSGLIAGLGLGGLAFALAAKDTVENIFGSIAILIDQPFRVGDTVNIGGVTGTVEQIGLRSTRLRTPDNSLISMPNSKVIAGHVDNLGARPFLRSRAILNLAYDTPPSQIEALCAGIRELLNSHPLCKKDSIAVYLNEFNATSLGVLVQFHLALKDWSKEQATKEEIYLAILTLVHELGISLTASPQELRLARSTQRAPSAQSTAPITANEAIEKARTIKVGWGRPT